MRGLLTKWVSSRANVACLGCPSAGAIYAASFVRFCAHSLAAKSRRQDRGGKIEAASFGVLERGNFIYVERVRAGLTRLGVDIRIGSGIPAAVNVLAQTILAHQRARWWTVSTSPPATSRKRPGARLIDGNSRPHRPDSLSLRRIVTIKERSC